MYRRNYLSTFTPLEIPILIKKTKFLMGFILILLILLCGIIVHANTLLNPFIWDDEDTVVNNVFIRDWHNVRKVLSTPIFQGSGKGGVFYRPLQILMLLINYRLWQLNPFGYRLTNLIFHLACASLVFLLLMRISEDKIASFLGGLFYIIHPVHNSAFLMVGGVDNLLAGLLIFINFIIILSLVERNNYLLYFLGILTYWMALFSKEVALAWPLFLIIYYYLILSKDKRPRHILILILIFFISAVTFFFLRTTILGSLISNPISLTAKANFYKRLLTFSKILFLYLGLSILPLRLYSERNFIVHSPFEPLVLISFLIDLLLIFLGLKWWANPVRNIKLSPESKISNGAKNKKLFLGLTWFLIFLLPVSQILVPLRPTMSEHYLYLPLFGLSLIFGMGFSKAYSLSSSKSKIWLTIFLSVLFIFYGVRAMVRNSQVRDPFKFYLHDLRYAPGSFLLHNNLGVFYFRQGNLTKAKEEFAKTVELEKGYDIGHNNLGVIYEQEFRYDLAEREYVTAIHLGDNILAYDNLGRLYLRLSDYERAIKVLERGVTIFPEGAGFHFMLGLAYYLKGERARAEKEFETTLKIDPSYALQIKQIGLSEPRRDF